MVQKLRGRLERHPHFLITLWIRGGAHWDGAFAGRFVRVEEQGGLSLKDQGDCLVEWSAREHVRFSKSGDYAESEEEKYAMSNNIVRV